MIQSADLHKAWAARDNSRLIAMQFSFRLPVHVAAKLAALEELYPNRTRTEIVGDLLTAALDDVAKSLPPQKGRQVDRDPDTGEAVYEDVGLAAKFRDVANKHYKKLEQELGNKSPVPLYTGQWCVLESDSDA